MNWATVLVVYFIIDFVLTILAVNKSIDITPRLLAVVFLVHALFVWALIAHLGAFA